MWSISGLLPVQHQKLEALIPFDGQSQRHMYAINDFGGQKLASSMLIVDGRAYHSGGCTRPSRAVNNK